MRRYKTPEQLKQWRKDNGGLTHIGQYGRRPLAPYIDMDSFLAQCDPVIAEKIYREAEECKKVIGELLRTGAADYDEITRNEFLHKDHA